MGRSQASDMAFVTMTKSRDATRNASRKGTDGDTDPHTYTHTQGPPCDWTSTDDVTRPYVWRPRPALTGWPAVEMNPSRACKWACGSAVCKWTSDPYRHQIWRVADVAAKRFHNARQSSIHEETDQRAVSDWFFINQPPANRRILECLAPCATSFLSKKTSNQNNSPVQGLSQVGPRINVKKNTSLHFLEPRATNRAKGWCKGWQSRFDTPERMPGIPEIRKNLLAFRDY